MQSTRTIKRILIANRGEIARRIIRTATRLGIETVAVFTDPDCDAPYVREATSAVSLGGADQYLNVEAILRAAKSSGADAIHPGYGFLSESATFARLTSEAGLVFIGPSSAAIEKLGSKTKAKSLALAANVPTSPTLLFTTQDLAGRVAEVTQFGMTVGFPLLIKAAAGGGGRGMRILTAASDIAAELESAAREAEKAFGDGEVFVERFLSPARHIEVQIVADTHGAAVAIGTRDCSLQRNNQKIIEEGPAPHLLPGVEQRLFQCATELATAAGYSSLGTVEFLYLEDGSFFFLEVNTRLQVEHPVTEEVTGLDLVEIQIRLAEGRSLAEVGITTPPPSQGHAIEARLCAEEYRDGRFINATGVIADIHLPEKSPSASHRIRLEMGVTQGSRVSYHYDSMLGKLIVHAPTRAAAITGLRHALSHTRISGVATNRALLLHLLQQPLFISCAHTIQGAKELFPSEHFFARIERDAHIALAALRAKTPLSHWAAQSPWLEAKELHRQLTYPLTTTSVSGHSLSSTTAVSSANLEITLEADGSSGQHKAVVGELRAESPTVTSATIQIDADLPIEAHVVDDLGLMWTHLPHGTVALQRTIKAARSDVQGSQATTALTAHLPGKIVSVTASVGDSVMLGDILATLDSMKMEHPLRAPCTGTVSAIRAPAGTVVQSGTVIVELAPG
jgi:acetyl/propionyl-CoA carboxylase alpha subunit